MELDILITSRDKPTLYKDGELVFVTADAVEAVIEVKTTLRNTAFSSHARNSEEHTLQSVLKRFASEVQFIRENAEQKRCWAGLFVFGEGDIRHRDLLKALQVAAEGVEKRVIDCVARARYLRAFLESWKQAST